MEGANKGVKSLSEAGEVEGLASSTTIGGACKVSWQGSSSWEELSVRTQAIYWEGGESVDQ